MLSRGDSGDVAILPKSGSVFYAASDPREETGAGTMEFTDLKYLEDNRRDSYLLFGNERILPNGHDNNFPRNYKNLLDQVYIGHGIKRSLINLLLSGGVGLYRERKEGSNVVKDWQLLSAHPEIDDWLMGWGFFTDYLAEAATDMIYVENNTVLFSRNKGARHGFSPKVASMKLINAEESRLQYTDFNRPRKYIYQGDWTCSDLRGQHIIKYPLMDVQRPFAHPHSAMFVKMPTFASQAYGRPTDIGATEMLKLLAILPQFHRANLTEKPIRWLIKVNSAYYDEILKAKGWSKTDQKFIDWKEDFKTSIDTFLYAAKGDKVQTRFFSEFTKGVTGQLEDKIQIEQLDDKTKELSETGLALMDSVTIGYVSANSIHPQLANIHLKNHALSGSNLKEAYDMHIQTATPTMRNLLLWPVNQAIRINWPKSGLKLGFMDAQLNTKEKPKEKTDNAPANS